MISQVQAQETAPVATPPETDGPITAPYESDIIPLEESPDGETHVVIAADGTEHVTGVFPPLDVTTYPSQLLWLAITFAALFFLLNKYALPRIGSIIEDRRDRIEGDLAEAERLRQKTDQAIATYEAALAAARANAQGIAEQAREANKVKLDAERARVEADLAGKMADAETRIAATKTEALGHVDEIAAETAQAVVAQLLGNVAPEAAREAVAKVGRE